MAIDVIMDNGGGITIQTDSYTHYYDDPAQAAEDYKQIIAGTDPVADGWDGNNPDGRMEYDCEQVRNGGYRWLSPDDIAARECADWGYNISNFYAALTRLAADVTSTDGQGDNR